MPVDMIDEKLDFALAGLLGWVNVWDGVRLIWVDGATKEFRRKVTDWHPSSDPDASLEVQAKALEASYVKYCEELRKVTNPTGKWYSDAIELAASLLGSTARQRTEAAYMTLSSRV
ncbi:hypothetical protein [Paenibacillus polymyxa]|uniref:hypothetical protein n=1 Tax=Paenibacillus polymyxa TaxID=1406 RepID=UPI000CA0F46A|nr:hypothetical protein [Paenibacillus polymyxa]APB75605.2 hypothetical protein PPYC2_11710 [Paenibacillus polymyxa]